MPPLPETDHKRELNRLLNKFFVACTFGDDNTKRMAVGKELHEFVDGVAAPLIARVAELQAALNELYVTCPTSLECKDFHHSKSERHSGDQPCKPAADFLSALTKARTALSAKD